MNYGGNMPDWHQFNTSQTNEVSSSTQNINSGHLTFIPGVSPTLNPISLNSEGLNKHQNDANYNSRNFQSFNNASNGTTIPNNSPLASMVQMQNCIGHYGSSNTRNPMLDNINASVDPRNTTIGTINDEIGYRSNQVPFNGPIGHLNGPNCNLNAPSGPRTGPGSIPGPRTNSGLGTNPSTGTGPSSMFGPNSRHGPTLGTGSSSGNMGPRNTNINSLPPGKPGPSSSFIPCKGLCCNSDPNINYQQWEKFGSYQNNTSYRDNVHSSNYQMENKHFGNNCNFRKDNLEGKEVMSPVLPNAPTIDHRRNFADYKYHKDHLMHRNYVTSSGMFHNYSMQNYNYSTEHQKYPYPVKEHTRTNNMNMPNSGILKHQEQNFIPQQKFNNKQFQYQNGNMLSKGMPNLNVNTNMASSSQNPYFNSQFPRNISAEMPHECQETTDNTAMMNRMQNTFMHNSSPQHQVYQHKIAMQKFSIENHLRELSRIPGYQSHPKYKECILRYREVLKLQQSSGYQNPVQQTPRVATPMNTMPPINLQFDQNGMLINSNYLPDNFPKLQHAPIIEQASKDIDKQNKGQDIAIVNEKCQQSQQSEQLMIPQQNEHVPSSCTETFQKQNQFSIHEDFNQNQLKVQTSESHSFNTLNTNTSNETITQQKTSKEFANKPDLDVRQFLANWDETDDEDGTTNLPDTVLSETTPVVVVSYENIDLSSKTQNAEVTRKNNFCSDEVMESNKEGEANVITAQDCLTISYSAPDNSQIVKTSKRTIGEGVVKPGSIIHCISNGPDEIPTIHIVDNLEISNILGAPDDQVIQTLEKQKTIPFFRESNNDETEAIARESGEQESKSDTSRILPTDYTASLDNIDKDTSAKSSNICETVKTVEPMNNHELRLSTTSEKESLDVGDNNMELKKQHSFEESHNPDDISLPDLPTSECTPISTTLNTPIHSDTEESSQNIEDLSIPTNPIEVMQNSPVISFTQLNSEDKAKNRSLDTLELEFQKENNNRHRHRHHHHHKSNETNTSNEQEVGDFDFSDNNSKAKFSSEAARNKKSFEVNSLRKKACLMDGKEDDARNVLTSVEYESEVEQEDYVHERKHKSIRRSMETTIRGGIQKRDAGDNINSNANLSPTASDDESRTLKNDKELYRRKQIKDVSTNTACPTSCEIDLNIKKRAKEATSWKDKCAEKIVTQKRDTDHSKQSKVSDARKSDDCSSSIQGEQHPVCHTTSQYKHYSVAVIKDNNVALNDKRTHGSADRSLKSAEFPSKMNNTKELPEEAENRKHASSKTTFHENIQSQTSKLLQKDLKTTVDGDVRYTAEEMRLLKEYRRTKERMCQDTQDERKRSKSGHKARCSQNNEMPGIRKACLEQNSSVPGLNSANLQEEAKKGHPKSLAKGPDFGIQVANVNLKIKDNDIGKKLILGDKGQEHVKDSLEGIQIEINVSCTERNAKEQQSKRLLYDDRSLYEIHDSSPAFSVECQRRPHAKDEENDAKLSGRGHGSSEKFDALMDPVESSKSEAEKNLEEEMNPAASKGTCDCASDNQLANKPLCSDASCKDVSKTEVIQGIQVINCDIDPVDIMKSKSAISSTAIIDANNKIKGKSKLENESKDEDNNNCIGKAQKNGSTSSIDAMEKEMARTSTKLPESNVANSLSNFDLKNLSKYSGVDLDHRPDEGSERDEAYAGRWKKPKIDDIFEDCEMFQSSNGYINPIFSSIDKLEDLHAVPVYTTKDGKISYSPNRRFTYHELMMEARKRDSYSSVKKSHYTDNWNNYYNSSKFRKLYKRKRHHGLSERKKYEYKNTKYLYDRKRNNSDEFYNKNHVKYKDYVHSIRNNNAVWTDHYKMDKMYSSSDSDEQIMDRNKNCVAEASKKDQNTSGKATNVSKSQKDESVGIEKLDLESKDEENNGSDNSSNKDKDLGDTQPVEFNILDKSNEDCEITNNPDTQSNIASTSAESDHENAGNMKQNVENNDKCLDNSELNKPEEEGENLRINENENSKNECADKTVDKIGLENGIIRESEEKESVDEKDESTSKQEKSSMNENMPEFTLCDLEEEKNDKSSLEGTDIKQHEEEINTNVFGDQTPPETENNFESIEMNKNSETDQLNIPESVIDVTNEVSELQAESNAFDQISQEFLNPEKPNDVFNEMVEKCGKDIGEENILECEKESVQFITEVEIPSENYEEDLNEGKGKDAELLKYNDDNSLKDTSVSVMEQEEPESQLMLTDLTDRYISVETIEYDENINPDSDQIDEEQNFSEEQNFVGFPEDQIDIEDKCITETVSNKGEIEVILSNIEETLVEETIGSDGLRIENEQDDLLTVSEMNCDQDSLVDKETLIFDTYCANSPGMDVEMSKNKTEEDESKEEQIPREKVNNKSLISSSDSNTDVEAIPKLIIKKADASNLKSECSIDHRDSSESYNKYDTKLLSELRPKIPKVIIMKNRSRSVTPTVEILEKSKHDKTQSLIPEQNKNMDVDNKDVESYTLKYSNYENKVPKVRIKLEDISSKDLKLYLKRKATKKTVPKMRIKKFKTQESERFEMENSSGTEEEAETSSDEEDTNFQESMSSDMETERIPKLKLKKQEENKYFSPERSKGKDSNISKISLKKNKRIKEEDSKHTANKNTAINDELKKKFPQCIIEKIPKVIIKRTQIGTEFKCEISKSKKTSIAETSKWQPKVKLQRLNVLDYMVKDLKQSKSIIDTTTHVKDNKDNDISNEVAIDNNNKIKLSRSNSVSNLSPTKCKQRRLSDSGFIKIQSKSITEFDDNLDDNMDDNIFKSNNNESKNLKKKGKKKLFSQNEQTYCNYNDESENEIKETVTKHSFRNILTNENNDLMVVKKKYSSFGTKGSTSLVKDKFLDSVTCLDNNDNDSTIIKIDSSDESQTTIEILPASPNSSDDEPKNSESENTSKINMANAIPTQLELELELIDNNNMYSDIFASKIDYASHSKNKFINQEPTEPYFDEFQHFSQDTFDQNDHILIKNQQSYNLQKESNDYFYCNDLLVKEVLAAKETLKKCLTRPENIDIEEKKSRLRTVAEKKQGLSFSFNDFGKSLDKFEKVCTNKENDEVKKDRTFKNLEKKGHKSPRKMKTEEIEESCSKQDESFSLVCPTASTHEENNISELTTISLKASKKFDKTTISNKISPNNSDPLHNNTKELQEEKSQKKNNSSEYKKENDNSNDTKTKEDNMPLLVPEFSLNFDSNSDRDSSRSPPVITNQEEIEQMIGDVKLMESKMISQIEKIDENKKHSYKDCEMTIADIITQLAYHEKV